jgi:hypothetical protein
MTFKVASTDVAWWHRIGELGKPTRSWTACFSDPAKHTNFWDMAMALANELANLNIRVEKWDSSKIGGRRGGSKGKPGGAKGYTTARAGHIQHTGCGSRRGDLNPGSGCGHACSSGFSPDTDGGAL